MFSFTASEIAGVWDTYEAAIEAGYDTYGLEPFLVKKIERIERVPVVCGAVTAPVHNSLMFARIARSS